jgi:hypothetical protein
VDNQVHFEFARRFLHFRRLPFNPILRHQLTRHWVDLSHHRLKLIGEFCGDACGIQRAVLPLPLGGPFLLVLWHVPLSVRRLNLLRLVLRPLIGHVIKARRIAEWILRVVLWTWKERIAYHGRCWRRAKIERTWPPLIE